MHVRILGSAAGGGVPQWNCRCPNCAAVRAGSADVRPRTQSSVAVSADGHVWFLLNVSPDIRQQIMAFPALGPPAGRQRGTGIAGCILTDAELDHTAGLLHLREGGLIHVHCTSQVRHLLHTDFPVEPILAAFSAPHWTELPIDGCVELCLPGGTASGLEVRAIELSGHLPRFVKDRTVSARGAVIALQVRDSRTGGTLLYAPCIGSVKELAETLLPVAREAACVLLDGTFWDDDEPMRNGISGRTAGAMGHVPVSGPDGSLRRLGELRVEHRVYVHINNTNPMLNERGLEHRLVKTSGMRVGADGDGFEL